MLSKYFQRSEFACKCGCGFDSIDSETLSILENIREHFDSPVTINSACRCVEHNASVGGASKSQHVRARAADIVVKGVDPATVADYAESLDISVGRYSSFTHIDTRSGISARWNG
jgi:uncharacterized protein YcbK (DUF882 family)|tara:strand:+ start:1415 stop:1759 length:345 start_codon:yes stop_codon:yes gene_type:complete